MNNWILEETKKIEQQEAELVRKKKEEVIKEMDYNTSITLYEKYDKIYMGMIMTIFLLPILSLTLGVWLAVLLGCDRELSIKGLSAISLTVGISFILTPNLDERKFKRSVTRFDKDNQNYWKERPKDKLQVYIDWSGKRIKIYDNISVKDNKYDEKIKLNKEEVVCYVVNKITNSIRTKEQVIEYVNGLFKDEEERIKKSKRDLEIKIQKYNKLS